MRHAVLSSLPEQKIRRLFLWMTIMRGKSLSVKIVRVGQVGKMLANDFMVPLSHDAPRCNAAEGAVTTRRPKAARQEQAGAHRYWCAVNLRQ